MAVNFKTPSWAGEPPPDSLYLDVMKGDKLVQKLKLDRKSCYLFGRNPEMNDFCTEHTSCSRVHATLAYHKLLGRAFLIDLGSTHGTFIGSLRLEADKPTQLPIGSSFHFGASTRTYILREKVEPANSGELGKTAGVGEGLLTQPETDIDQDNLTEFNTTHNSRVPSLEIPDGARGSHNPKKKKSRHVTFNEEAEIINPEDVDPSIGRFRNLVKTTVIPFSSKRQKLDSSSCLTQSNNPVKHYLPKLTGLYDDLPPGITGSPAVNATPFFNSLSSTLGLPLPNPAPEIEPVAEESPEVMGYGYQHVATSNSPMAPIVYPRNEPRKKTYAKEVWPGKCHSRLEMSSGGNK